MSGGDRSAPVVEHGGDGGPLVPGECQVWLLRHSGTVADGRDIGRRERSDAVRAVLVELLRRYLPGDEPVVDRTCVRCGGPHGRPMVLVGGRPSTVRVSVAHSGAATVLAFSGSADIGVDVEVVRSTWDWAPLLDLAFSEAEQRQIEVAVRDGADGRVACYERWVAKEAVLKAMGVGLAGPLRDVDTTGGRHAAWNGWTMAALPLELPLVGALACAESPTRLHMLDGPDTVGR